MVSVDVAEKKRGIREALLRERGKPGSEGLRRQSENYARLSAVRGEILSKTTDLEYLLNVFLSAYFSRNDFLSYRELGGLVFEEMLLGRKIEIFARIGYHAGREFGGKYEGLPELLRRINRKRTLAAHGFQPDMNEAAVRAGAGEKPKPLDEGMLAEFNADFEKSVFALDELIDALYAEAEERKARVV